MAVKLRLQRHGRGKRPFYHIVAADSRSRRDGRFIERVGDYNPLTSPATIHVDVDKALQWLLDGAEPTNTVKAILKYKGVLYKKHLVRGVTKGAFTQEVADQKFQDWVTSHQNAVLDHKHKVHKSKEDRMVKMLEDEAKIRAEREAKRIAALAAAETAAAPQEEATEQPIEQAPEAPTE